ncbi:MAG TPA: pitrilysin family protein, partial [Gemmatimonadales bacterium]|nr:pitrilysin family protein [Gemmatimonadales bacterium]
LHVALPGADLLVRRKPGVPIATLGVYLPRLAPDPASLAGLAALTVRASVRGAGGLAAPELAYAFERLGGSLASAVTGDWWGFGSTVHADRLAEAAVLLRLVLREPHLAADDIARERGLLVEEAQQAADDMFRYPFQLAFNAAFGDSGYGLPTLGLPETLAAIGPADVRRWHEENVSATRAVVVAVGDVDPADTADRLAGVFGDLPPRAAARARPPQAWIVDGVPATKVVAREKAQSALAMAFPGPSRRDRSRHAAEVWAAVASGLGGRLFEALRDRRSLAYTVLATSWQRGLGGALLTYIATSPEREEEAREAMLRELGRFVEEPVTPAELDQARNYLAGQAEVQRQSGGAVAGEILEAWLIGEGLEELADPGAAYRRVSADDVRAVAAECLRIERRAEGVVRGTGGGK